MFYVYKNNHQSVCLFVAEGIVGVLGGFVRVVDMFGTPRNILSSFIPGYIFKKDFSTESFNVERPLQQVRIRIRSEFRD